MWHQRKFCGFRGIRDIKLPQNVTKFETYEIKFPRKLIKFVPKLKFSILLMRKPKIINDTTDKKNWYKHGTSIQRIKRQDAIHEFQLSRNLTKFYYCGVKINSIENYSRSFSAKSNSLEEKHFWSSAKISYLKYFCCKNEQVYL